LQQVGEPDKGEDGQHAKGDPWMQVNPEAASRCRAQRHRQTGENLSNGSILFLKKMMIFRAIVIILRTRVVA
jgi:hypothetical protein